MGYKWSKRKGQEGIQILSKGGFLYTEDTALISMYNRGVELKNGTKDIYNFTLIKDKELLSYISGDKLKTIEEKEANYKKFFETDDAGNLLKDKNGQYIFSSDKFKAEFGKDVGTDNKLQLAEREYFSKERKISATAEKNAIKASGLDYRRDNTGLYRTIAGAASLAALAFGLSAKATADGVGGISGLPIYSRTHAYASAKVGGIVGAIATGATIPFIHDKDGKTNKRQDAADLYKKCQNENVTTVVPLEKIEPASVVQPQELSVDDKIEVEEETPCYNVVDGVPVETIRYGGYWHYANLYNNCDTGKPLTTKQINELTQLLKPGHVGSSIQKGNTRSTRILQREITLKDGTKVCLADNEEIKRRVAKMKTRSGGRDMKLDDHKVIVRDCNGNIMYTV